MTMSCLRSSSGPPRQRVRLKRFVSGSRRKRNNVFPAPAHLAVRWGDVAAVQVDQIFAERRRLLGRKAVVCAMCGAVPADEQIRYLFRRVCEFGTVVPFKLVTLKSRAEQRFHFRLVAPLKRARHAGRWWDILIGNLEHTPDSAFSRPRLDCNATVFARHPCDLVRCLLLIGCEHETARGHDDVEGAIGEWKIFRIAFLPRDVVIACIRGTFPSDGEKPRREVDSRDHGSACAGHECCIPGAAGNVEHPLTGADARASYHMVSDCLDAMGNLVVVSGCPDRPVFLFQFGEVWHSLPRFYGVSLHANAQLASFSEDIY